MGITSSTERCFSSKQKNDTKVQLNIDWMDETPKGEKQDDKVIKNAKGDRR